MAELRGLWENGYIDETTAKARMIKYIKNVHEKVDHCCEVAKSKSIIYDASNAISNEKFFIYRNLINLLVNEAFLSDSLEDEMLQEIKDIRLRTDFNFLEQTYEKMIENKLKEIKDPFLKEIMSAGLNRGKEGVLAKIESFEENLEFVSVVRLNEIIDMHAEEVIKKYRYCLSKFPKLFDKGLWNSRKNDEVFMNLLAELLNNISSAFPLTSGLCSAYDLLNKITTYVSTGKVPEEYVSISKKSRN